MDERKHVSTEAQGTLSLYGMMFTTSLFAIGCIKHLIRLRLWNTLVFAGIEDIALIFTIATLWRYRRMDRDVQVRDLAQKALSFILLIGIISSAAMGQLNR
jgi:uncharacterized membrane protein